MGARPSHGPVLTEDPCDPANPDCDLGALEDALGADPVDLAPSGGELLRYGWASAALEAHPELHLAWAGTADRAIRRAVMRSPALPPEAAELVVATRRSGMHTLGSNPAAPVELLAQNPSALRRREVLDELAPGGVVQIRREANRLELAEVGSGTVDLVLAHAPALIGATARTLAARVDPVLDPWVAAVLVERFGEPVWRTYAAHASAERRRAVEALSSRARELAQD